MLRREDWVLLASAALLLLTIWLLYVGCRCPVTREPFANPMSPEEQKLFEELKGDRFSPSQIDDMVTKGVIDQKLVEKFLNQLESSTAASSKK